MSEPLEARLEEFRTRGWMVSIELQESGRYEALIAPNPYGWRGGWLFQGFGSTKRKALDRAVAMMSEWETQTP